MKRFIRQAFGTSGGILGANGSARRTLFYSFSVIAVFVAVINAINVITLQHASHKFIGPSIIEGSSWLSLMVFVWIPWIAWRLAPPDVRPRRKLLLHLPAFVAFASAHVGLFDLFRVAAFGLMGQRYEYGSFPPQLLFEMRKDVLGYAAFIGLFTLLDHLLGQVKAPAQISTFDIRDGATLMRVAVDEIVAVASAGNYVEFYLADGRRLLMRVSLRNVENALAPEGFVRTHRSWLVNGRKVTTLKPDGSGDYTVELGRQTVPLSRRFPAALAKLRGSRPL